MVNADPDLVIQTQDLRKTYRSGWFGRRKLHALQGVSLNVPRGKIYGLLGPNGAGKTTLIKILLGIVRRTGGDAVVLGEGAGSIAARRRIGYLPENHRIPRHLTGATALEFYGQLSGLTRREIRGRQDSLLTQVGLRGREHDRVSGYSKGMLQRLGLAQAMLHNPELIILDEPTDGVDPVGRKEIREVLRQLAANGTTIFLNSHLLQEIELVCESVAILQNGALIRNERVAALKEDIGNAPVMLQIAGSADQVEPVLKMHPPEDQAAAGGEVRTLRYSITEQAELDCLIDAYRGAGVSILSIRRQELSLEDAFLKIVGGNK